jgi:organic radical activating enzyme
VKLTTEHKRVELTGDNEGYLSVNSTEDGSIVIKRYANRGNVTNQIAGYELVDDEGNSTLTPLTIEKAYEILERVKGGMPYSSAYIFYSGNLANPSMLKSSMEHSYTSTGIKFWRHQEAMFNYKNGNPNSVISSHISPEGACNLKCPYCSVTYRDTHSRIPIETIVDYVEKLQSRGLKAVILTGGGEPTAYPKINELIKWLKYGCGINIGMITNGTLTNRLDKDAWKALSWVRVSINIFDGWETKIKLPTEYLDPSCVVGASSVFTVEHEATAEKELDRLTIMKKISGIADRIGAKYVRILPNCLLEQSNLLLMHGAIDKILEKAQDPRFFHQHKVHGAPRAHVCHQAYFRPYLSEEPYHKNGMPGTVFPCDSVVLNEGYQHFSKRYQICHASEILDFLDRRTEMQFDPSTACTGCVFTENVNLLEDFKSKGLNRFDEFKEPLAHEDFV